MIPNRYYFAQDVFDLELRTFFAGPYRFAGLTSELGQDRDFVCIDHPGTSIVVQNFKGELRAFENICTHRFNKLQTAPRGNRPLTCSYHGWSFDGTGYPVGMPKRAEYAEAKPNDLCLARYEIETCGKFLFVRRPGEQLSLRDFLGPYFETLQTISENLGPEVYYDDIPHEANWKLLVENVLDNHHCNVVHRDTFLPGGFCKLGVQDVQFHNLHSSYHVPRTEAEDENFRRRWLAHLKGRGFVHDSFYHIHIFPSLFIASTEGMSFYVGNIVPETPRRTRLLVRYFEPLIDLAPRHRKRQDEITEMTNANGAAIIQEDRPILENMQKGIEISSKPGVIASGETRVRGFMERYQQLIDSAAAADPATVSQSGR